VLGMALRVPPFDPGNAGESFDREQVPHGIVTLGEAGKVGVNTSQIAFDRLAGHATRADIAHASRPSSEDGSGALSQPSPAGSSSPASGSQALLG
jgi:hypothetical protein